MKLLKFENHKLFIKSISFYSLVILLPLLVLGFTNYYFSLRLIDEKNEKIFNNMLLKTQNSIETKMNTFNNLTTSLSNNSRLETVLYEKYTIDISEMAGNLDYYFAISELKQAAFYHDHIESIALYINDSKIILHSDGVYGSSGFLGSTFPKKNPDFYNFLMDCTTLYNNFYYVLPDKVYINYKQTNIFTLIKAFPNGGASFEGAFMLFLDTALFDELLPSSDQYSGISTLLIDEGNNLIAGNPYVNEINKNINFAGENGVIKGIQTGNTTYNAFYKKLDNLPWKLVIYVPSNSAGYFYGYTKWFLLVFIVFVFIGLLLSSAISYSSYKPVTQIINAIKAEYMRTNGSLAATTDEHHFIESNLANMNHTVAELRKTASLYKSSIIDLYILKLLTDTNLNKSEIAAIFELLGIDFKNSSFLVCTIGLYSLGNHTNSVQFEEYKIFYNNFLKYLNTQINTIDNLDVYVVNDINNHLAMLFYWSNNQIQSVKYKSSYNEILNILDKAIIDLSDIKGFVGAGLVADNVDGIHSSYENALSALSYAKLVDIQSTVEFPSISNAVFEPFYFPLELENDILKALKNGDYTKINSILNFILDKNTKTKSLDLVSIQCLYYELYATLIKGRKILNPKYSSKNIQEVSDIYSINALIAYIENAFEKLCLEVTAKNAFDNTTIRIQEFIDKNFQNSDISLNYIANQFQVSPYYVSRIFHSDTEAGFLDYINTKRIQHAVQLLKASEYSVAEVSKMSGFSNFFTFTRVFKRYQGTTPGNFKQIKTD